MDTRNDAGTGSGSTSKSNPGQQQDRTVQSDRQQNQQGGQSSRDPDIDDQSDAGTTGGGRSDDRRPNDPAKGSTER